jgi:predicted methyltransferase
MTCPPDPPSDPSNPSAPSADLHFRGTSMPDRDWWSALWPDPTAVLRTAGIAPADTVLDLCCGDGWFTVPMGHLVGETGRVLAIELQDDLAEAARLAVHQSQASWVHVVQGDAMRLRELVALHLPEASLDHVFIANTLHGVPDPTAMAAAVFGQLRPGGRFSVVNWWPRPREETQVLGKPRGPGAAMRFSPDQVAAWVEPAGFRRRDTVDVGPFHYCVDFERPASERSA